MGSILRALIVGTSFLVMLMASSIHLSEGRRWFQQSFAVIGVPVVVAIALGRLWKLWLPSRDLEARLARATAGIVAGGLLMFAAMVPKTEDYFECAKWVQGADEDGPECIGDVIKLAPGPIPRLTIEQRNAGLFVVLGLMCIWIAFARDEDEK